MSRTCSAESKNDNWNAFATYSHKQSHRRRFGGKHRRKTKFAKCTNTHAHTQQQWKPKRDGSEGCCFCFGEKWADRKEEKQIDARAKENEREIEHRLITATMALTMMTHTATDENIEFVDDVDIGNKVALVAISFFFCSVSCLQPALVWQLSSDRKEAANTQRPRRQQHRKGKEEHVARIGRKKTARLSKWNLFLLEVAITLCRFGVWPTRTKLSEKI